MPSFTKLFRGICGCKAFTAHKVFALGHYFQMRRVNAAAVSTKMVNLFSFRDFSDEVGIRRTVGVFFTPVILDNPVISVFTAGTAGKPMPTASCFPYLNKKAFFKSFHRARSYHVCMVM